MGGDLLFERHPKNGGVEVFEDRRRFSLCGFLPDDEVGEDTDCGDNGESTRLER